MTRIEDKINEETVLIGHSLGTAFILNYLEKTSKKIKAAILVAAFHRQLGIQYDEINRTFVDRQFNWEKIKASCNKFFIFNSDNDPWIPLQTAQELAKNLDAELNVIHDGGHLNKESGYGDFPLLLETIVIEVE